MIKLFALRRRCGKETRSGRYSRYALVVTVVVAALSLSVPSNVEQSLKTADNALFAPSDGWQSSLSWMEDNTPEPLGNADVYYEPVADGYEYPDSAYGVTAWWDYGYWITRIGRRIPTVNPTQTAAPVREVANLFLSDGNGKETMDRMGSLYIVADYDTAISKFHALIGWAGKDPSDYAGGYYIALDGELSLVELYYPAYYESLFVRLYNFDGSAVEGGHPLVINYVVRRSDSGELFCQITQYGEAESYEAALNFVGSQQEGNWEIVGVNRFVSPIPLEPLLEYKLVHASSSTVEHRDVGMMPEVKIFEYVG